MSRALAVVIFASTIPRREGGDADDKEMAAEKRRCRRVGHALNQSLTSWVGHGTTSLPNDAEIQRLGAQLEWTHFKGDHLAELDQHTRMIATWAVQNDEQAWGRRAVVKLNNELNWVTYALRD